MSADQWAKMNKSHRHRDNVFAHLDSWCKSFNAGKRCDKISWHTVQTLLQVAYPEFYHQLVASTDTPSAQAFVFDYWGVGGDLRNLNDLDSDLRSRLLQSFAPSKEESHVQANVQEVLENIAGHLRNRVARVGGSTIWNLIERFMTPTDPAAGLMPTSSLKIQRRMHPVIAEITRLTYPYLRDHTLTATHPAPVRLAERMFWFHHRIPELDPTETSTSHVNMHEVALVKGLVHHLLQGSAYSLGDIAVLTPYNDQLAALHENLKTSCAL